MDDPLIKDLLDHDLVLEVRDTLVLLDSQGREVARADTLPELWRRWQASLPQHDPSEHPRPEP